MMKRLLTVALLALFSVQLIAQNQKIAAGVAVPTDGMKNFWKFNNSLVNSVTNGDGDLEVQCCLVYNCLPSPPFFSGSFYQTDSPRYGTGFQTLTDGAYNVSINTISTTDGCYSGGNVTNVDLKNVLVTNGGIDLGDAKRTISLRVKFTATNADFVDVFTLGSFGSNKGGFDLLFQPTNATEGKAKIRVGNDGLGLDRVVDISMGATVDEKWHTFAFVYDGVDVTLYYNGTLVATIGDVAPLYTTNTKLYIGSPNMLIDELRMYDRDLSADEITALNNADVFDGTETYTYVPTPIATSVNDKIVSGLTIFPNPASDVLQINSTSVLEEVSILNSLGIKVLSADRLTTSSYTLDCSLFDAGVYWIKVTTKEGSVARKIIIN